MLRRRLKIFRKIAIFSLCILVSVGVKAGSFDDFFSAAQTDNESAIVNLTSRGFDLNTPDEAGQTGLLLVLRLGSIKVTNLPLQQNAIAV